MSAANPSRLRLLARQVERRMVERLPPLARGVFEYYRARYLADEFQGPLNGQAFRRRIVERLFEVVEFDAIIETGTYRGTTTEYLASKGVPVLSVELDARAYGFALARLWLRSNVKLRRGDSATRVREWLSPSGPVHRATAFFYLDAHWNDALPLWDELRAIFERPGHSVVLIDDFAVPEEPGYGFDAYSAANVLDVEHLLPVLARYDVGLYFPSCPAEQETGKRRGTVVVASRALCERLDRLPELRGWSKERGYAG